MPISLPAPQTVSSPLMPAPVTVGDAPRIVAPAPPDAPLGVYVHVPFCAHVCPYCDFNTYAGQGDLIPRYVASVEREIEAHGKALHRRSAETVFFGGGTPSLLPPDDVGRLVRACRSAFDVAQDAEITIEANPNGLDERYFASLLDAGVNRLSLGVQTLDRRGLRTLGRLHEARDAAAALSAARSAGFRNISLDLIFGWPGQTPDLWRSDLDAVLNGGVGGSPPDHLSLYGLIVEPGTPMADAVARGILAVPDDDASADLYETAIAILRDAGWVHYEVANWARRPDLASRHNIIYWRNADFVGIGAGAHGTVTGCRTMNHPLPATYCAAVERGSPPVAHKEEIAPRVAMGETMMLGLRLLSDGVSASAFAQRHGRSLHETFGETVSDLIGLGLVRWDGDHLLLSHRGLMLANDACARFV